MCVLVPGACLFSSMQTHVTPVFYGNVANGEFKFFKVRQHSNMLMLSPNRCIRRHSAVCVCIHSWEVYGREAARVGVESFFYRRRDAIYSVLQSAKKGGRCFWAMGVWVKTVLMSLFKGCPNRRSLFGFFPCRSSCLILYGRRILNLRLKHFGVGIAILPGQFLA